MKTEADRLVEFILDRTPTISKRESEVNLQFADGSEAEAYYLMLCELIEDIHAARKAKAAIEAGGPTIPWEELKAELLPDCSDIPEITELGPRPERDAEGRLKAEFRPAGPTPAIFDEQYRFFYD